MSGVAAIIRFDGGPVEPSLIEKMTAAMAHRGPDGIHHWVRGSVALGQCMLRTTPESLEETQPLTNEDGSFVLVMDGRVDNWEELRTELLARGARLRTRADTELVLRAYEVWGKDCVAHIDGDFAIVIWNARTQTAFCARDHAGNKPFFYRWDGHRLMVASDQSAILSMPGVSQAPNLGLMVETMSGNWPTRDETLWREVKRLPPARHMVCDRNGPQITEYWMPPLEVMLNYKRDEDYVEHYRALFEESVRRHSRSHLAIAYEVSGGLDSSAVFCMAERLRKAGRLPAPAIKGYTWDFNDNSQADESEYVRAVSAHVGLVIREIPPFRPDLEWMNDRLRQERDITNYPNGMMAESLRKAMAADGCRVVINGEGGDEWAGGHRLYYPEDLAAGNWRGVQTSFRADAADFGLFQATGIFARHGLFHLLPKSLQSALRWTFLPRGPNNHVSVFWLSPQMQRLLAERRIVPYRQQNMGVPNAARRALLTLLQNGYADHARELIDRSAARSGMEARTPFYSRPIIEFAFKSPARVRLRGNTRKYVHVKAMQDILPQLVLERKTKADFSVAFKWQLDNMKEYFVERVPIERRNILSQPGMDRLFDEYMRLPIETNSHACDLWMVHVCHQLLTVADEQNALQSTLA